MFFEVQFPTKIGFGAVGGPSFSTIVNMGFSGLEQRNRNWLSTRNKYQLDLVSQPLSSYQTVLDFFLAVAGKADPFRFKDDTDFQATGISCSPALGDGNNKIFQLQQQYTIGAGATQRIYTRSISKPIMSHKLAKYTDLNTIDYLASDPITDFSGNALTDTVKVFLNGINDPSTNNRTIDATTGLATFQIAPGNNVAVTNNSQYHIPVRFDSDEWPAQVVPSDVKDGLMLVTVTGIQLLEVKITPGQAQG